MRSIKTLPMLLLIAASLACGYSSNANSTALMPAIAQLNPTNATAGGAAFTLTVNGSNFLSNAVVNWNNVAQATTVVSGNQLLVAIAPEMISDSGTVQITVTNPGMVGRYGTTPAQTSAPMDFTID